jgi:hypothetical protein
MIRDGDEAHLAEQTVELVSARRGTAVPVDDLTA